MDNKEIILSKISEILSRRGFFLKSNSEFKSRLKCVGLGEYFEKYSDYLIPYYEKQGFTNEGLSESQYAGEVWYNLVWENENLN